MGGNEPIPAEVQMPQRIQEEAQAYMDDEAMASVKFTAQRSELAAMLEEKEQALEEWKQQNPEANTDETDLVDLRNEIELRNRAIYRNLKRIMDVENLILRQLQRERRTVF